MLSNAGTAAQNDRAACSLAPEYTAREKYYSAIDMSFREWLSKLNASDDESNKERLILEWRQISKNIADRLAEKMISAAGKKTFIGKTVKIKEKDKEYTNWFSSPKAELEYKKKMKQIYERR